MSIYTDAIRIIEKNGWRQGFGNLENFKDEPVCLMDSLWVADEKFMKTSGLHDTINSYLSTHYGMLGVEWNDVPDRTKEEVIALLKELEHELEGNSNSLD